MRYPIDWYSMSVCAIGKLWGISSLTSSLYFQGPFPCHTRRLEVISCGWPYFLIIVRATSAGFAFHEAITCSARAGEPADEDGCSPRAAAPMATNAARAMRGVFMSHLLERGAPHAAPPVLSFDRDA